MQKQHCYNPFFRKSFLLILLLTTSGYVFSANRYWVASSPGNWNNTANWSTTSGGTGGASVPGSADIAIFDNNGNKKCTIDANVNIVGISVTSGFTDTIVQSNSYTITVGGNDAAFAGGVFLGGNSNITINGDLTISGTAFTSTSAILAIKRHYTLSGSGSFSHNNGETKFTSAGNYTAGTLTGSTTFYNLTFEAATYSKTPAIDASTTFTVNNDLKLTGSALLKLQNGTIEVKGNITTDYGNNTSAGTTLIVINGTGSQTLTGSSISNGALPKVTINKSSGTLYLSGQISVDNDWTYTAGTISAGTSTVAFSRGFTITGTHTLNKVIFQNKNGGTSSFTLASGTTLTINDTLQLTGSSLPLLSGGTIEAKGNIVLSATNGAGITSSGTTVVKVNGSGNQKISGPTTTPRCWFPTVQIEKSGNDTLFFYNNVAVCGQWIYKTGTLDFGSSTLGFVKNANVTGNSITVNHLALYGVSGSASTVYKPDSTGLTVNGNFYVTTTIGTQAISLNGKINVKGNIYISNGSHPSANSGTITLNGTGNQTVYGNGPLRGTLPHVKINKSSGTLYIDSIVSIMGNWELLSGTVSANSNSKLYFDCKVNPTIKGNQTLKNLSVYRTGSGTTKFTVATGTTITVDGNFETENTGTTTLDTGDVIVKGNIILSNMLNGGTGRIHMTGTTDQSITATTATNTGEFPNLTINKNSGKVKAYKKVAIKGNLNLLKGNIESYNSDSLVNVLDNGTVTNASDTSFATGPFVKEGNDAFTFPLGKNGKYRPFGITAPSLTTDIFQAEYFDAGQTLGSKLDDSLEYINTCQYWKLDRLSGTSAIKPTLNFGGAQCNIPYDMNELRMAWWDATDGRWESMGSITTSGNYLKGSVTTVNTTTTTGNYTTGAKPLTEEYGLPYFKLDGNYYTTRNNILSVEYPGEYNVSKLKFNVYNDLNQVVATQSNNTVVNTLYVTNGDNRFRFNFGCTGVPLTPGFYIMEIINEKNEKMYMRFKQTTSPGC